VQVIYTRARKPEQPKKKRAWSRLEKTVQVAICFMNCIPRNFRSGYDSSESFIEFGCDDLC
jgi:hypothetical protein